MPLYIKAFHRVSYFVHWVIISFVRKNMPTKSCFRLSYPDLAEKECNNLCWLLLQGLNLDFKSCFISILLF